MRPSFQPRLVNGPYADPGLFVPFSYEKRAFLFDLGDLHALSPRDLLKVSHVFVSHTHMDHFLGFDQILRLFLGREKTIRLYGPDGFIERVQGRLSGYEWNLVESYSHPLTIVATEMRETSTITQHFPCGTGFRPPEPPQNEPFSEILWEEDALQVSGIRLDHGIPCLGFSIQERFHINIRRDALDFLGLSTGPWLYQFKQALFRGEDRCTRFRAPAVGKTGGHRIFALGELAEKITRITPGQKVTYITDVAATQKNLDKIISFAANSDQLFIEAAFLSMHHEIALRKKHLTAEQAGMIAGKAGVRQYTLFHHSPRYTGESMRFQEEARKAFAAASRETESVKDHRLEE